MELAQIQSALDEGYCAVDTTRSWVMNKQPDGLYYLYNIIGAISGYKGGWTGAINLEWLLYGANEKLQWIILKY